MVDHRVENELLGLLVYFLISLFTACTETYVEIQFIGKEQEHISYVINSRSQVLDVEYAANILSIALKNRTLNIDTKSCPYICSSKKGSWTVNGIDISKMARFSDGSSLVFPALEISPDGYLLVDGCRSQFRWNEESKEKIISDNELVWAISQVGSYICFYHSDSKTIIPIVDNSDFIIPDYFFDLVVEKELLAEEKTREIPKEERMSYVFFTDAHWGRNQKHSPALIKHIVDYSSINYVLFGGDANTNRTETAQGTLDIGFQFQKAFSFLGPRFYCLFGNHDDNSTGQPSLTERHLSEEQVYAFLQSQMVDANYWDYYNFYFDDLNSNTRFICLDTGRYYDKSRRGSMLNTAKFIIECLDSVPDGWHIIAASHIWANLKNSRTGESIESIYVRPIIEVLENYNLRAKSAFSYDGEVLEYDFSGAGATIEYCIGGHIHADAAILSQKGLPILIVTCDGQQEVAGGAPYQTGTVNEQCVTIVVNDYQNREVNIYHIGRGNDVSMSMWDINQGL